MNNQIVPDVTQNKGITLQPVTERNNHIFKCACQMCQKFQQKRIAQLMREQQNQFKDILSIKMQQNYLPTYLQQIIKNLIPPTNKIVKRGIQVYIPEICYFEDGEPTNFYFTRDIEDYHLVRLKKDKINTMAMQKIFNQRRRNYRQKIRRLVIGKQESKLGKLKFRWRKDSQGKSQKNDNMNSVIIRYIDGCQTLTTQNQLLNILQKRKQDPFWKRISSIRNYVHPYHPHVQALNTFDIHYQKDHVQYSALGQRAFQLMRTYAQRQLQTSPLYISEEDEYKFMQQLKKQSYSVFAHYTFYKIVSFIHFFADQQIKEAKVKMMVNELQNCYLLDVNSLTMTPLTKYNWTNQIYMQRIQNIQNKKYHQKDLKISSNTIAKSTIIQDFMETQYSTLKDNYGITAEPKQDMNQKLNNQFFSFLYPAVQQNLSEIVKINIPMQIFRKKFLGQIEERRSIVKPFNSKFVRELHRLTPAPRRSKINEEENTSEFRIRRRGQTISHFSNTMYN